MALLKGLYRIHVLGACYNFICRVAHRAGGVLLLTLQGFLDVGAGPKAEQTQSKVEVGTVICVAGELRAPIACRWVAMNLQRTWNPKVKGRLNTLPSWGVPLSAHDLCFGSLAHLELRSRPVPALGVYQLFGPVFCGHLALQPCAVTGK